jgi:aspartyl-tRNA(Asn)/glutamyl-tRNA(Gln) amidotransferase subunit A
MVNRPSSAVCEKPPLRLILGCPKPFFLERLDDDIRITFEQALARLRNAGWTIHDIAVRHARYSPIICLHLVLAEAAATHTLGLTERADQYTEGVRLRLELGRYVMGEDYARAQHGRQVLGQAVDDALDTCDALVLPTLAIPAPRLATTVVALGDEPEPLRNAMLRLTQLFNATGHPAVSLPCGLTTSDLPCGLQLIGRRNQTDHLLDVAAKVEAALTEEKLASGNQ